MPATRLVSLLLTSFFLVVSAQAEPGAKVFKLHFLDHETRQPIANTTFTLVPLRIISDPAPGQTIVDPNLKFAESIHTHSDGLASLPEDSAAELSKDENTVSCQPEQYGHFILTRTKPLFSKSGYQITVFTRDSTVGRSVTIHPNRINVIRLHSKDTKAPNKSP